MRDDEMTVALHENRQWVELTPKEFITYCAKRLLKIQTPCIRDQTHPLHLCYQINKKYIY